MTHSKMSANIDSVEMADRIAHGILQVGARADVAKRIPAAVALRLQTMFVFECASSFRRNHRRGTRLRIEELNDASIKLEMKMRDIMSHLKIRRILFDWEQALVELDRLIDEVRAKLSALIERMETRTNAPDGVRIPNNSP